jgi:tetratricopeptide (TPR) repeat protein
LLGNFRSPSRRLTQAGKSLLDTRLRHRPLASVTARRRTPCKTRSLVGCLVLLAASTPLLAQQKEADEAWSQGRLEAALSGYRQVLAQNPRDTRANLRVGVILSWNGKLDSSLVYLARARASAPMDSEIRLIQARVMAWNQDYSGALAQYDSVLALEPGLRDALLGRAQTLAWAGRLQEAGGIYGSIVAKDPGDRDALLGRAQVNAWGGQLQLAQRGYEAILSQHPRDADALAGLGYIFLWQGRTGAAKKTAETVLAIDSTHQAGRALRRAVTEATRPSLESSANWSNDSDKNTSFWQALALSASLADGVGFSGSFNALETHDPVRTAQRIGGEAGLTLSRGPLQLSGAAGARRLYPETAPSRTAATYRGRLSFRPMAALRLSVGYSRAPFDEIASLIERGLNLESLEGGVDVRPVTGLSIYGGGGALWLNDGNHRTSGSAGITQRIQRSFSLGVFGRTLSYQRRGVGYFSPDRFSVLEGIAGYSLENRSVIASAGGGVGGQKVGKGADSQTEWHVEGRIGRKWGAGNRIELFGLVTNSAVSSTTGAFRYRSAGINVRLGL